MSGEAGVDPALVEVLDAHEWQGTYSSGIAKCGCGDRGKRGHHAHLAAVLEPYVQQRVAAALEGAATAFDFWWQGDMVPAPRVVAELRKRANEAKS